MLYDLAIGASKLGVDVAVATPKGYQFPDRMKDIIQQSAKDARTESSLVLTHNPAEAINGADVLVTDTWISMGITSPSVTQCIH